MIGEKIVKNSVLAMKANKKETMSPNFLSSGAKLTLNGEIEKHAYAQGTRAITKYQKQYKTEKTRAGKAGLVFPPARVERVIMRKVSCVKRISEDAPIYLAAVLEYLCAELLELAGNVTKNNKAIRITTSHLSLAVELDSEIKKLMSNSHIHVGRANIVDINPHLFGKSKTKSKK